MFDRFIGLICHIIIFCVFSFNLFNCYIIITIIKHNKVQVSKSNGATADEKVKVEWTIMFREMTQQFARIVELMVNRQMLIQITNTVKDK